MAEFRRSGMREFYKVEGDVVVRVTNKEKFSRIDVSENRLIRSDAMDEDTTKPVTESEFNEQLELANERIKNQKI